MVAMQGWALVELVNLRAKVAILMDEHKRRKIE